uniref:Uncharacterized protein n=1 Tax=Panagrolaimus superbus TaxID=310955 RepID=A0A914Y121_9BILA
MSETLAEQSCFSKRQCGTNGNKNSAPISAPVIRYGYVGQSTVTVVQSIHNGKIVHQTLQIGKDSCAYPSSLDIHTLQDTKITVVQHRDNRANKEDDGAPHCKRYRPI